MKKSQIRKLIRETLEEQASSQNLVPNQCLLPCTAMGSGGPGAFGYVDSMGPGIDGINIGFLGFNWSSNNDETYIYD